MTLRERRKFRGDATEELLQNNRYTLRHQTVDNGEEVKAEGVSWPLLVEVFDEGELTYEQQYGFRDNAELRNILEIMRREIDSGIHASKKRKNTN